MPLTSQSTLNAENRVATLPQFPSHAASALRHYRLLCPACGAVKEDDGYMLVCTQCREASLLQAIYEDAELTIDNRENGICRYRHWLPVCRILKGSPTTVVYQSERLARTTGLENLWIAFHGYWPERNANLMTGSFKDLEAYCVLGRVPPESDRVLVVASAGNTAAAFARAATLTGTRCLIVVPYYALASLRLAGKMAPYVKVVAVAGDADYGDAIRLAERLGQLPGFVAEGGAKNIARRAGSGAVLLSVFETIGKLPDYYFQAIGSGTGAIGVHETARRLTAGSGPFPRLWLSQNQPFTPIYDAWSAGRREWAPLPEEESLRRIARVNAKVLANRFPPYALRGGLYDVLTESAGILLEVSNEESAAAASLFEESEGVDVAPAAAVAFASLLRCAKDKLLPRAATVVLNVTGGGQRRRLTECEQIPAQPHLSVAARDLGSERIIRNIESLFCGHVSS